MSFRKLYYAVHKPYNMLSQFTDSESRPVLKNLFAFPADVYPVGRLDMDSEGLLLLTNDKPLTNLLLHPKYQHEREYTVLVEGVPDADDMQRLVDGVVIERMKTLPAKVNAIQPPESLQPRVPELRLKPSLTYSWISLTITEGRNRQVRKMTAAVGHPTIRLIRNRIANITLNGLPSGGVRELTKDEVITLYRMFQKR